MNDKTKTMIHDTIASVNKTISIHMPKLEKQRLNKPPNTFILDHIDLVEPAFKPRFELHSNFK